MPYTLTFDDDPPRWLYRAVPMESAERFDVGASGEIHPPRPDRRGEDWIESHKDGNTETAYTSWSTDRETAIQIAESVASSESLSGRIIVFRVLVESLDERTLYDGGAHEAEYLIEGVVENVEFSDGDEEDEA